MTENKIINDKICLYFKGVFSNDLESLKAIFNDDTLWDNDRFIAGVRLIEQAHKFKQVEILAKFDWDIINNISNNNFFIDAVLTEIRINKLFLEGRYNDIVTEVATKTTAYFSSDNILKNIAIAFFKTGYFSKTIEFIGAINNAYLNSDFFLNEILAESCYRKNKLKLAIKYNEQALLLKPNLFSAKYKNIIFKYILTRNITQNDLVYLTKLTANANINILRVACYIQYSEKYYQSCLDTIDKMIQSGKKLNYLDSITEKSAIEKLKLDIVPSVNIPSFEYKFVHNNEKTLFIVLSSNESFNMQGFKFKADKLYLIDNFDFWYVLSLNNIVDFIMQLCDAYQYSKISIVGASKAGTAAIFLILKLQNLKKNVQINAVSCSPQIKLWPLNQNTYIIPPYRLFMDYANVNPLLKHHLEQMAELTNIAINPENKLSIFYGDGFNMDVKEIKSIQTIKNVNIFELNFSGHISIIPISVPQGLTINDLQNTFQELLVDDVDFRNESGEKIAACIDQIWDIYKDPKMQLINFL